jgi:hypothetical protein
MEKWGRRKDGRPYVRKRANVKIMGMDCGCDERKRKLKLIIKKMRDKKIDQTKPFIRFYNYNNGWHTFEQINEIAERKGLTRIEKIKFIKNLRVDDKLIGHGDIKLSNLFRTKQETVDTPRQKTIVKINEILAGKNVKFEKIEKVFPTQGKEAQFADVKAKRLRTVVANAHSLGLDQNDVNRLKVLIGQLDEVKPNIGGFLIETQNKTFEKRK